MVEGHGLEDCKSFFAQAASMKKTCGVILFLFAQATSTKKSSEVILFIGSQSLPGSTSFEASMH